MAGLLKLPHGSTSVSLNGVLFHCIHPDSKQPLIYFKLAVWSEMHHHAVSKISLLFCKKSQQPKCRIAHFCVHSYFIVTNQIAYNLRLISNLQHGLSNHPNVPSCSEEDLAFFSNSQGCSNYHQEMQAFLWMGIISLHPANKH